MDMHIVQDDPRWYHKQLSTERKSILTSTHPSNTFFFLGIPTKTSKQFKKQIQDCLQEQRTYKEHAVNLIKRELSSREDKCSLLQSCINPIYIASYSAFNEKTSDFNVLFFSEAVSRWLICKSSKPKRRREQQLKEPQ